MIGNSTYVMCGPDGKWCYWHQGTADNKNYGDAQERCQGLGGDVVWYVAALAVE